jgi:hypothetical protein
VAGQIGPQDGGVLGVAAGKGVASIGRGGHEEDLFSSGAGGVEEVFEKSVKVPGEEEGEEEPQSHQGVNAPEEDNCQGGDEVVLRRSVDEGEEGVEQGGAEGLQPKDEIELSHLCFLKISFSWMFV